MSQKTKRKINAHIKTHFTRYLCLIFVLFTGALCGVFSVSALPSTGFESSKQYTVIMLSSLAQNMPNLLSSILSSLLLRVGGLLFLYIGSVLCLGSIASTIFLLLNGFSIGFSVSLLFSSVGLKALAVLLGNIFSTIIFFIAFLYTTNLAIEDSSRLREEIARRNRLPFKERMSRMSNSWAQLGIIFLVAILIEGVVSPILMHFFASIMI